MGKGVVAAWVLGALVAAAGVGPARADDLLDKVNGPMKAIKSDRRSDLVLLPLLVKTAAAPGTLTRAAVAALMPADNPAFKEAAAWAQGEEQKAVLAAVPKVVSEPEWKKAWGWGQPYGFEGVDPDLVVAGAYTDLGDPPAMAAARHVYLPLVERMEILVHVEATRLAAEGKPLDAIVLMERWVLLARQLCDRAFLREQEVGYSAVILGLQRMRDLAYVDGRSGAPTLKADKLREVIDKLKDRNGLMGTDRLELPQGDGLGAEQMLGRIFLPRGGPNPETYAKTMGRIGARQRPLRLFSEAARWDVVASKSAGDSETREQLKGLLTDWRKRWALSPFDPVLRTPTAYDRLDKLKYAALDATLGDMKRLFMLRTVMTVELVGTKTALAMQGFALANRTFPKDLTAVRPIYIEKVDNDPYSQQAVPLAYFVPMRDTTPAGKDPQRVEMRLQLGDTAGEFAVSLTDDVFVVYSVGPDGVASNCRTVTQSRLAAGGDYLIWPPTLSLLREHLGQGKKLMDVDVVR